MSDEDEYYEEEYAEEDEEEQDVEYVFEEGEKEPYEEDEETKRNKANDFLAYFEMEHLSGEELFMDDESSSNRRQHARSARSTSNSTGGGSRSGRIKTDAGSKSGSSRSRTGTGRFKATGTSSISFGSLQLSGDSTDPYYDGDFLDAILKAGQRGGDAWNLLLQGHFFTNAGRVGHANLPEVVSIENNFFVPSMYVKDILDSGIHETPNIGDIVEEIVGTKIITTKISLNARKFRTATVSLTRLFQGCRAVFHNNRYFIHRTTGAQDAKEALRQTINKGDAFELALSKPLMKDLVDFIRILNRKRGYGCCEIASIGGGWFTTQNLELLGPEQRGFAESKTKNKRLLPLIRNKLGGRYLRELEQSRCVGTLRTRAMFEEYNSRHGDFPGPIEVAIDAPKKRDKATFFIIDEGGEITDSATEEASQLQLKLPTNMQQEPRIRPRVVRLESAASDVSEMSSVGEQDFIPDSREETHSTGKTIVKRTIVIQPNGDTVETVSYSDGSTVVSSTPAHVANSSLERLRPSSFDDDGSETQSFASTSSSKKERLLRSSPTTAQRPKSKPASNDKIPVRTGRLVSTKQNSVKAVPKGNHVPSLASTRNVQIGQFESPKEGIVMLLNDGIDGSDGMDGAKGEDASEFGAKGQSGMDASNPTPGGNAGYMTITLSADNVGGCGRINAVFINDKGTQTAQQSKSFQLPQFPNIRWSAVGGRGGNGGCGGSGGHGMQGSDGIDAASTYEGTNGQRGGNGGAAGQGSHGSCGGRGGDVTFRVSKTDAYLLTAVDYLVAAADISQKICGGEGGRKGSHGQGGKGGDGGKGGASFPAQSKRNGFRQKQKAVTMKGGADGPRGADGESQNAFLMDGPQGRAGTLKICVEGTSYSSLFDMRLLSCKMIGQSEIGESYEFGSVVSLEAIQVKNVGGMPIPAGFPVELSLVEVSQAPLLLPLEGDDSPSLSLDISSDIVVDEARASQGHHKVFTLADVHDSNESDFDPVTRKTSFRVAATLRCDNGFSRVLGTFDQSPKELHFRFPVENTSGIEGSSCICPMEPMKFSFVLSNVCSFGLGKASSTKRSLLVKVRVAETNEGGASPDEIEFAPCDTSGDQTKLPGDLVKVGNDGQLIDIPKLEANESTHVCSKIRFSEDVNPYSKVALLMEIRLQVLGQQSPHRNPPDGTTIQRRVIMLTCEPRYEPSDDADVVIITSAATSFKMYSGLVSVLEEMSLSCETYSLTRYGSLLPDFKVESGVRLRVAFAGKLVVLLNDQFQPNYGSSELFTPLHMLPPGGIVADIFAVSTRWLIIGNSTLRPRQDLLSSYLHKPKATHKEFPHQASFYSFIQSRIAKEAAACKIEPFTNVEYYKVPFKVQDKEAAKNVGAWLARNDGLRQYTVVRNDKAARLEVYCEYCRSANPGIYIPSADETDVRGKKMMLAIAESLSPPMRSHKYVVNLRCGASDKCLEAFRFASVGELTHEVSYLLDGSISLNDHEEDCFPTLGSFTDNIEFLTLIRDSRDDSTLRNRLQEELSDLVGRFEAVAMSKDLRPRNPIARNSAVSMHDTLMVAVGRIRRQWRSVMSVTRIDKTKQDLKARIKTLFGIGDNSKKKNVNVRADNKWMHGLAFVHSTDDGDSRLTSRRIVELDQDLRGRTADTFKISKPSSFVVSSSTVNEVRPVLLARHERHAKVGDDIRRIRTKWSCDEEAASEPAVDVPSNG